jgi:hypothetical protein
MYGTAIHSKQTKPHMDKYFNIIYTDSIKKPTHSLTSKTLFYIHIKTVQLVKNVL